MGTDIDFERRAGSKNVYLVLSSTGGIYVFNDSFAGDNRTRFQRLKKKRNLVINSATSSAVAI